MSRWHTLLENGSIRKRLQVSIIVLALLPLVVLLVSLHQLRSMSNDAQRVALAGSLRMSAFIVAAQLNSHLAQPEPYKLDIVDEELERMQETLDVLSHGSPERGIGPAEREVVRQKIAEATHALDLYWRVASETRVLVESGTLSGERLEEASLDVLGSAYGFLALSNLATRSLTEHARSEVLRLQVFQLLAVVLAALITVMTIWAVRRFVLRPIPEFLAAFREVSAERYGVQVEIPGKNEFSQLAQAFNGMSDTLEATHHKLIAKHTEVLEKNAELERAGKLKSQFVSNVSHELRTPLSAVIGYAQLLRRGVYGEVPESIRKALNGIEESTRGLAGLVNDILELAKIDAGRASVHAEELDLADVVQESADVLRPLTVAKGLRLNVETIAYPTIVSDRDKVRRILVNLGANAVKFTPAGSVTLRAMQTQDGWSHLSVEDTGVGIAVSDLDSIFEDFVQLEDSDTREHAGTGLGLPISQRLARRLGGEIRVESTPGRGSTFTLSLPPEVPNEEKVAGPADAPDSAKEVGHGSE